uniref:Uncharacterized protein n=1 Tax=Leersia perrieri TaxID=77586 RepID=A0A0D9W2F0_9ORYZ
MKATNKISSHCNGGKAVAFFDVPALCLALAGPNLIQNQQNNQQILLMWLPVTRPGRTLTMGSYQKLP